MISLPQLPGGRFDCWNIIGVRGDGSCSELARVVHCHNCSVFAAAGRRFLDAPSPSGYLAEWTRRLAAPIEEGEGGQTGVLIFRLAEEWLALPVSVMVEVTAPRSIHRVPHRGGHLAGIVNIRGELHLCAHLGRVLGLSREGPPAGRFLVTHREAERWVFPVDSADQVHRLPKGGLTQTPATVSRSLAHLTRGVFQHQGHAVGLLDDERLFARLRGKHA
jgi:chemotaxis-related protein WspD